MPVQRETVWTCLDLSRSETPPAVFPLVRLWPCVQVFSSRSHWRKRSRCGPSPLLPSPPALAHFKGCCCPLRLGGRSCESSAYLSETQLGELKIHRNLIFKYLDFPHIRTLEYFNAGRLFDGLTGHLSTVPFTAYSSQVFFLPMGIVSIGHFNEDSTSKFSISVDLPFVLKSVSQKE